MPLPARQLPVVFPTPPGRGNFHESTIIHGKEDLAFRPDEGIARWIGRTTPSPERSGLVQSRERAEVPQRRIVPPQRGP